MSRLLLPEDARWKPKYYTPPIGNISEGEFVVSLAERFLVARDGMKAGEPIRFGEWQKWLTNNVFELLEDGSFRYKKCLIMVPRKNGKTFLMAIYLLYHLLTAPAYAEIYSAAKDRSQASYVFKMVTFFIESTPELKKLFKLNKTEGVWTNRETQAFFKPLSADAGKVHGINPYVVVADEVHIWEGQGSGGRARDFWDGLVSGSAARENNQILIISTAGANLYGSILGDLYLQGTDIVKGDIDDDSFGFFCWEADESDDPLDENTWYKANPNLAEGLLNKSTITSAMKTAMATGMAGFLRFYLNIWARQEGDPFINTFYWQEAIKEDYFIPDGAEITAGFDGAQTGDTTCIVITELATGFTEVWEFWEKDETNPAWAINREEVEQSLLRLTKKYKLKLMWADCAYWIPDIRKWKQKYRWPITEVPPVDARMAPIAREFLQDLVEGGFLHGNDKNLNRYAFRALLRENGSFGKASKKMVDRIDLLVGAILANGAKNWVKNKPTQQYMRLR